MKGLTARLTASYLILVVIVLASAGALSYRVMSVYFHNADKFLANAQVDAAINWVLYQTEQNPDVSPKLLVSQATAMYPLVQVSVEPGLKPNEVEDLKPILGKLAMNPTGKPGMKPGAEKPVVKNPSAFRLPNSNAIVTLDPKGNPTVVIRFEPAVSGNGPAELTRILLETGLLALVAAAVMAFWFSRTLTAPLRRFVQATERLAQGEWDTTLPASGPSEIRALSDAMRRMAGHLSEEFQRLRGDRQQLQSLAAEVAHEIKTPIASLKTYHEQLLDGAQDDPETRNEFLRRGARQVERLEYLAEFMVDMARLRAHTAQVDRRETDLTEVAAHAVEAVLPEAASLGLTLTLANDGPVPVLASPQRLGQALDNLLRNALRWAPSGTTIAVTASGAGSEATVTVADQGAGVPPELLPKLFEPFVRGEGSQGMGLGLAIVAAIVQSYDGRVAAENRPEGGARFTLTLPLHKT